MGRSEELAAVTDVLADISTGGAALVIDGDPGIGKSTLLAAASDWAVANGYARLGCSGLQSQMEIGYAGLHELLHPLLAQVDALPPRQRAALMTAFGLEDGPRRIACSSGCPCWAFWRRPPAIGGCSW